MSRDFDKPRRKSDSAASDTLDNTTHKKQKREPAIATFVEEKDIQLIQMKAEKIALDATEFNLKDILDKDDIEKMVGVYQGFIDPVLDRLRQCQRLKRIEFSFSQSDDVISGASLQGAAVIRKIIQAMLKASFNNKPIIIIRGISLPSTYLTIMSDKILKSGSVSFVLELHHVYKSNKAILSNSELKKEELTVRKINGLKEACDKKHIRLRVFRGVKDSEVEYVLSQSSSSMPATSSSSRATPSPRGTPSPQIIFKQKPKKEKKNNRRSKSVNDTSLTDLASFSSSSQPEFFSDQAPEPDMPQPEPFFGHPSEPDMLQPGSFSSHASSTVSSSSRRPKSFSLVAPFGPNSLRTNSSVSSSSSSLSESFSDQAPEIDMPQPEPFFGHPSEPDMLQPGSFSSHASSTVSSSSRRPKSFSLVAPFGPNSLRTNSSVSSAFSSSSFFNPSTSSASFIDVPGSSDSYSMQTTSSASSSFSSASSSSKPSGDIKVKTEKYDHPPQTNPNSRVVHPLKESFREEACWKVRGDSEGDEDCVLGVSALIKAFAEGELPAKPIAPSSVLESDLSTTKITTKLIQVGSEKVETITALELKQSDKSRAITYPFHEEIQTLEDGEQRVVIDPEKIGLKSSHFTKLSEDLLNEARMRGGTAFGRIGLYHTGRNVNSSGHEIAFYATAIKEPKVIFYDPQVIKNGKEISGKAVFTDIAVEFNFEKEWGVYCFYCVDGPIDRYQSQLTSPLVSQSMFNNNEHRDEDEDEESSRITIAMMGSIKI